MEQWAVEQLQSLSAEVQQLKCRVRTLEALHQGDAKLSKTEAAKLLGVHPRKLSPILEAAFKAFREGTEYPITWGVHGDVYVHGSNWMIDRGALDRIQELLREQR